MPVLPIVSADHLQIISMRAEAHEIVITLMITTATAQCPDCKQWSSHIHSRYIRHLLDLPWGGAPVRIELQVRRFQCSTPEYHHDYFTERVPEMALPYRRRTNRFQNWLSTIVFAFGGEPTSGCSGAWDSESALIPVCV
jgi:transposase